MPPEEQGFLDKLYGGSLVVPILIAICTTGCCGIGLILSIVGMMQCQTLQGKANAKIATIISGALAALYLLLICGLGILRLFVLK